VWKEVEDKWMELDRVRDEWKEGERERRRKEMKRKEKKPYHDRRSWNIQVPREG